MHTLKTTPLNYRSDIDGLRAIAVLAVVAYHADLTGFGGGFVGVDVFFVISGFLITQHLSAELQGFGNISFSQFYAKRVRRLFPALSVTVLITLLTWAIFFMGIPTETRPFIKSIRFCLFGLANIYFKGSTGGYFDGPSAEMPLLHFWSLAVEEQFYLVWPMMLFLFYRMGKMRGVFIGLICLAFVSFMFSWYLINNESVTSAFYWMPPRAWELAVGGCLAFVNGQSIVKNRLMGFLTSMLGLALIVYPMSFYNAHTIFPGPSAVLPVFGSFLLILSGSAFSHPIKRILSSSYFVKIGTLSYGWYLWHWPLLALARVYHMGAQPPIVIRVFLVLFALLLAELSLKFIETPLRFGRGVAGLSPKSVMIRASMVAAFICLLAMMIMENERNLIKGAQRTFLELTEERTSLYSECVDNADSRFTQKCERVFFHHPEPAKEIVMMGDSHAFSYFPMLEEYAKINPVKATLIQRSAILPLINKRLWMVSDSRTAGFNEFNQQSVSYLKNHISKSAQNKVSVVLGARWMQRSGKRPIAVSAEPLFFDKECTQAGSLRIIEEGLSETIRQLKSAGVYRILVILPYPEFKYSVLRCHTRHYSHCDTPRVEMEAYRSEVVELIRRVSSQFSEVRWVDPVKRFCDSQTCPQVILVNGQEIPVVFDNDHPSVAAAKLFGESIRLDLDWLTEEAHSQ